MCMCTHTYTAYIGGGGSIYQNQMSMLHTKTHIKCIVYHHETASPYDITVIVENDEFIDEFGIDENVVNWVLRSTHYICRNNLITESLLS